MSQKHVSYPQDQNGDDTSVRPVQTARKYSTEAANVAYPTAKFICLRRPLYLFCHGRILPLCGRHPSIVCKEHQGNWGLSCVTILISKGSQFGTLNGSNHFKNTAPQQETRNVWIHPTLGWEGCRWESPQPWLQSFLLSKLVSSGHMYVREPG